MPKTILVLRSRPRMITQFSESDARVIPGSPRQSLRSDEKKEY